MDPQNRKLVLMFGAALLIGGVVSLQTGVTYFRGTISRDESPRDFWTSVACLFALGIFLAVGGLVAP
ncbi:MAG: hypothetical protein ACF8XB_23930 [Planctomycetota bacterium JB042]